MRRRFDKLLFMAGFMVGCGGDDTEQSRPVLPPGPPELEITALASTNGERYVDDFSGVALDCSAAFVVELGPNPTSTTLTNWTLRGPGQCGSTPQCGFVALRLELGGDVIGRHATASTTALFELPESAARDGSYSLSAELVSGDGELFVIDDESFSDRADVGFVDACGGGAGGQSAQGGQGGDEADAGGAAGKLGAGGAGAGGAGGTAEPSSGGAAQGGAMQGGAGGDTTGGQGGEAQAGAGGA